MPTKISPYINFQGRAQEAMVFYQKVLGGELKLSSSSFDGATRPAGPNDPIIHAVLTADGVTIMGTDGMPKYPPTVGDNIAIALSGSDRERLAKVFNELSEGGKLKGPLKRESSGDSTGKYR